MMCEGAIEKSGYREEEEEEERVKEIRGGKGQRDEKTEMLTLVKVACFLHMELHPH